MDEHQMKGNQMNDLIQMAREAGAIPIHERPKQVALVGDEVIERFAQLVNKKAVEDEREAWVGATEHLRDAYKMALHGHIQESTAHFDLYVEARRKMETTLDW
jgi:lipase chaperone LimK